MQTKLKHISYLRNKELRNLHNCRQAKPYYFGSTMHEAPTILRAKSIISAQPYSKNVDTNPVTKSYGHEVARLLSWTWKWSIQRLCDQITQEYTYIKVCSRVRFYLPILRLIQHFKSYYCNLKFYLKLEKYLFDFIT